MRAGSPEDLMHAIISKSVEIGRLAGERGVMVDMPIDEVKKMLFG